MTRAPVAVGDLAVVATGSFSTITVRVEAVTRHRVLLAGLGWATRTETGAERWSKPDRRVAVTFRAQSNGADCAAR